MWQSKFPPFCLEAKLLGTPLILGSSLCALASCMLKKLGKMSILEEMPFVKSCTCFLMYLRKALEDQCPISMIMNTGTCAKYMAIPVVDWFECVPMPAAMKPSLLFSICATVAQILSRISFAVMGQVATPRANVSMVVVG
eukprot:15364944-Ditylum_brightwellii.AAC.6